MLTPSELDEIRKRCEAADHGSDNIVTFIAHSRKDMTALLDEERLQRENETLRNRPPMNCTACEDFNQELADKNRELEHENDELHEAISDDAAATLADRNEIRQHLNEVLDALMFAGEKVDLNIEYKDASARTEALVQEVKRLRARSGCNGDVECDSCDERDRLAVRLALLEPVWEAAKRWRENINTAPIVAGFVDLALANAIDAAVAKEGK